MWMFCIDVPAFPYSFSIFLQYVIEIATKCFWLITFCSRECMKGCKPSVEGFPQTFSVPVSVLNDGSLVFLAYLLILMDSRVFLDYLTFPVCMDRMDNRSVPSLIHTSCSSVCMMGWKLSVPNLTPPVPVCV